MDEITPVKTKFRMEQWTQLIADELVTFARLPISLEKTNRNGKVIINFPSATVEIMDGAAPETIEAVLLAMKVLC